jgi:replicative DNA helicase Mcm
MRADSSGEAGDSVPITARQLEALIRVAEASARAELQEEVHEKDAERAIEILKYTMEQVGVDPETGDYDADIMEGKPSSSQRNRLQTMKKIISDLGGDEEAVKTQEVVEMAEEADIPEEKAEEIINKLKSEGELFEPQQGSIQKI